MNKLDTVKTVKTVRCNGYKFKIQKNSDLDEFFILIYNDGVEKGYRCNTLWEKLTFDSIDNAVEYCKNYDKLVRNVKVI